MLAGSLTNDEALDGLFGLSSDEEDDNEAQGAAAGPPAPRGAATMLDERGRPLGVQLGPVSGMPLSPVTPLSSLTPDSGSSGAGARAAAPTRKPQRIRELQPAVAPSPPAADANVVDSLFASSDDEPDDDGAVAGALPGAGAWAGDGGPDADGVDDLFDDFDDDDDGGGATGATQVADGAYVQGSRHSDAVPPVVVGAHAGDQWGTDVGDGNGARPGDDGDGDVAAGDDDETESLF